MRLTFVTSEVRPFSQTGGLADVSESLPAALAASGCDVTVVSPLYRSAAAAIARAGLATKDVEGPPQRIGPADHPLRFRFLERNGCRMAFVVHDDFYDRPALYVDERGADYADNVARYAFLCRAAIALAHVLDAPPDIVHCSDWQTGLLPCYLRAGALPGARSVFTIHNLGYQGHYPAHDVLTAGLGWTWFHPEALEFYGGLNLMKGGLFFSDAITTVSPSYAEEIQTPAAGRGLDGVLRAQRHKLHGILNGIDVTRWNPAADPHLPAPFSAGDLAGKAVCKRALQDRSRLPREARAMLFGAIARFDWQKGMPLICDAFRILAPLGMQLVILGAGDSGIEAAVRALAAQYPRQVAVTVGFDEGLAHLIEAGADAFLMPSAYEPCGLNQMYSQRYGTVPIVHATGGLKDTVTDVTPARLADGTASGFSFATFDAAHLAESVLRAWRLYADDR
ncbi:MAG TPA: glycogen synthase GlgA, partial [Candidatus Dormibacteraeota bacterium]|nr:glycogen synthase GlgA [Candidatus Dormibacteraeota bacterium]